MNIILFLTAGLLLQSCRKDQIEKYSTGGPTLPSEVHNYEGYQYPTHFTDQLSLEVILNSTNTNPVTNDGATLGRVLFYDTQLSANTAVSCSSCHLQEFAFTDNVSLSPGFKDGMTDRNSMSTVNLELQRRLFWDRRANSIEEQVLMPIEHPIEMGMTLTDLEARLSKTAYYPPLFEAAFGDDTINAERIAIALGQFMRSIKSYNSKFDKGFAVDFSNFTTDELAGKDMFFSGDNACANCHFSVNMGGVAQNINGLSIDSKDKGIGALTGVPSDMGRFKTVSLRNIMLTAPYMHDGRFEKIEDVINFYSTDIKAHPYLDSRLTTDFSQGGNPKQLNFTDEEKMQLKAFFSTLTDWELIENPAFSDPFTQQK